MDFEKAREKMVRRHLRGRDIRDERVLDAFRRVPRERFVWEIDRNEAHADHPVRIGEGQTISQPYMVALMTQWLGLGGHERVLEIGTGSGYQTAILAELAREVFTIERFQSLSASARECLDALGYENIRYRVGDGTLGWPEEAAPPSPARLPAVSSPQSEAAEGSALRSSEGAKGGAEVRAALHGSGPPFDAIIVTAGAPRVPEPLKRQLAPGGRLVIPVGPAREQDLFVVRRRAAGEPGDSQEGDEFKTESVCPCIFVKLVGEEGWLDE